MEYSYLKDFEQGYNWKGTSRQQGKSEKQVSIGHIRASTQVSEENHIFLKRNEMK